MSGFCGKIGKLNVYVKPVSLFFLKETGHRTLWGVFFTLSIFGIIGILIYNQVLALIYRNNPNFSTQQYEQDDQNEYFLTDKNFSIVVSSANYNLSNHYILTLTQITDHLNTVQEEEIVMSPCEQQLLFVNNSQIQYCINWEDNTSLKLQGFKDSNTKSYLKVNLKLCENCQQLESIEIKIMNSYIDNYDKNNPHKYISHKEIIQLSKQFQKQLNIQYQVINLETDNGYIVEDLTRSSSLIISKSQEIYNDLINGNQFSMIITLDNMKQNTKRSYQKVQMVLSDLGGLTEILYLFCFILIFPYNEITYRVKLLNELFNFNLETEENHINDAQVFPTETSTTKSRIRLKSIFNKTIQLEKVNRMARGRGSEDQQKSKIIDSISESITGFLKEQHSQLEMGFWDYILYFCPSKQGSKRELVNSSMVKISKTLDITYIIQKLHEIDKLKQLFMDENQIKMFDCLPKPKISSTEIHQPSYLSILKPEQSDLAKALEAQQAYEELVQHSDNQFNHKLIEMLDQDLLQLFQMHMDRQIKRKTKKQVTLLRLQGQIQSNDKMNVQSISDSDSDSNQ